jgi:putative YhdH/YhfP family quinone oxidoreductase
VGSLAINMLANLGYEVVALTRREDFAGRLRALGAAGIVSTAVVNEARRPLEKGRFAAAIDNVGGDVLSWLLRSLQPSGLVASVGNAAGIGLATNVLPFILRQAHLFGVVANAPWPQRHHLWSRLAGDWKPDLAALWPHVRQIGLKDLPGHCRRQVDGATSGRTLVTYRSPGG